MPLSIRRRAGDDPRRAFCARALDRGRACVWETFGLRLPGDEIDRSPATRSAAAAPPPSCVSGVPLPRRRLSARNRSGDPPGPCRDRSWCRAPLPRGRSGYRRRARCLRRRSIAQKRAAKVSRVRCAERLWLVSRTTVVRRRSDDHRTRRRTAARADVGAEAPRDANGPRPHDPDLHRLVLCLVPPHRGSRPPRGRRRRAGCSRRDHSGRAADGVDPRRHPLPDHRRDAPSRTGRAGPLSSADRGQLWRAPSSERALTGAH